MEFKKRDLLVKENKSEDGIVKKVLDKLGKIKDRATSEVKETSALVRILTHAVKSYTKNREFDLNDEDREFIKGQSADVVRTLILTIIAIIPIPIPLTPFLIIFGNKIGIDLTPKEHEIPEKGKSKKQKLEEQKLNIILTKDQYKKLIVTNNKNQQHNKNYLKESTTAVEMNKPSGNKLEWPECPEGQYWDFLKNKCVDYGFSEYDSPKQYSDTHKGMDEYFAKQKELFLNKINDTKQKDKTALDPLLKMAKDWWRKWLNDPITISKHQKQFNLTDAQTKDKFKNYLKVIDNIELVVINRYGDNKDDYAFITDAYIDSNLSDSSLGHIFDKEYDALIQNGSNEIAAWLGSLVSTASGGNNINDCRVFVPSPLMGEIAYYETTFTHEIQHLLENRVGPLTSKDIISKSFPKPIEGGVSMDDIKKSTNALYGVSDSDVENKKINTSEGLKLDLNKGIKDLMKLTFFTLEGEETTIPKERAEVMLANLLSHISVNDDKDYDCDHEEKTANLTELRNQLRLTPGETLNWNNIVLSYWNEGWVRGPNNKSGRYIKILPVYRMLACWTWNNFTPDLKTLFENLDNFAMSKENKGTTPTSSLNDKNLELSHFIRKNNKNFLSERNNNLPIEKKLKEQKLNIILTKEQIDSLNENLGIWANRGLRKLNLEVPEILKKLCSKQKENGPFCRLSRMSKFLDENIKVDLEVALETLNSYFKFKNVGMFPVIIDLALNDEGRTVEYLKLISDFIQDESQDKTQTKRVLNKQRNTKEIPKNFEELLKQAKYLEHQKYEEKFVGDYFDKKGTFLRLNYNCGDDAKDTLFTILTKVKSEEHTLDIVFEKIKNCIQKSLTQGTYYLKADLVTKQDLKCSGDTIFPSGTYFEVKKMDPFIDSYLSEFFSIFKQTETITYKPEYISLYNELIDRIYNWLLTNPDAKEYLNKVKSQMGGIIYEYDTIVPTEYIDLYWSNKGQRGCDEKRLSIRFRIDPKFNEIETYKFKNNEELTPKIEKVTSNKKEKVFCE